MNTHNVGELNFGFNNRKNSVGICRFRNKVPFAIEISNVFAPYLSDEEIKDTILHEIAHALAGREANHDHKWKAIAKSIGANPSRTAETIPQEITQKALRRVSKYRATCKECDTIIYFQRMTKNWEYDRYRCPKCYSRFNITYN